MFSFVFKLPIFIIIITFQKPAEDLSFNTSQQCGSSLDKISSMIVNQFLRSGKLKYFRYFLNIIITFFCEDGVGM